MTTPYRTGNHRQQRTRSTLLLVITAVVAGVLLGIWARSGTAPADTLDTEPEPTTDSIIAPVTPGVFVGRTVQPGENLALVLGALGFSGETARLSEAALARTDFDFQRLMPGDSITVEFRDSLPYSLCYHIDRAVSYQLRFLPDSSDSSGPILTALAERVVTPVETTVVGLVGEVRGSLWQALLNAGADDKLAADYNSILRHQLPALSDMHPGDSFRLVVERLTVADSFYAYGTIHALRYQGSNDVEAFLHTRPDGLTFYCGPEGRSLNRVLSYPPIIGARITSDYGSRIHPVSRRRVNHNGIDYEAAYGTPIRAVADGTVQNIRRHRGYGRMVDVTHARLGLTTRYAHLSRYAETVKPGSRVNKGDIVGYVGSTGLSSGAHLHFETIRDGRHINPLDALPSAFKEVLPEQRAEFEKFRDNCRVLMTPPSDPVTMEQ